MPQTASDLRKQLNEYFDQKYLHHNTAIDFLLTLNLEVSLSHTTNHVTLMTTDGVRERAKIELDNRAKEETFFFKLMRFIGLAHVTKEQGEIDYLNERVETQNKRFEESKEEIDKLIKLGNDISHLVSAITHSPGAFAGNHHNRSLLEQCLKLVNLDKEAEQTDIVAYDKLFEKLVQRLTTVFELGPNEVKDILTVIVNKFYLKKRTIEIKEIIKPWIRRDE